MPTELEELKDTLDSYHIPVSMEWLESCAEWCKNDLNPNYTIKELYRSVYQQWLFLDLRMVEILSLPANLSSEKRYNLTGIFYLQIMKIVDISKPKLWQLQRIRNKVAKNTELEKDFGKRVLQLTLTDGVQEVEAMEFKPVPCLNINLRPGSKLNITGPVMVRNGRLMLEPVNVKPLGGYVEELLVTNAAENVLARALGLEENPTPNEFDEKILEVPEANTTTQSVNNSTSLQTTRLQQNRNQISTNIVENNHIRSDSGRGSSVSNLTEPGYSNYRNKRNNTNIQTDFVIDDDLLRELEEDFEDSSVQNFSKSNAQTACTTNKMTETAGSSKTNQYRRSDSPDLFEGMDIDDELLNDHLDQLDSVSALNSPKPQSVSKLNDEKVIVLDDSFSDIDIDSHLDRIDEEMSKLPSSTQRAQSFKPQLKNPPKKLAQSKLNFGISATTSKNRSTCSSTSSAKNVESNLRNFANSSSHSPEKSVKQVCKSTNFETSSKSCNVNVVSIEKLKSLIPNVGHGKFKIKGKFKEVKEKLTINATDIYMVITVEDNSGEITAQIHSSIVETLANTTLNRLKELRELTVQSDNRDAKKEILEALKRLRNELLKLDTIMDVQIARGEKYPMIVKLMDKSSLFGQK